MSQELREIAVRLDKWRVTFSDMRTTSRGGVAYIGSLTADAAQEPVRFEHEGNGGCLKYYGNRVALRALLADAEAMFPRYGSEALDLIIAHAHDNETLTDGALRLGEGLNY
jgi:hypothetical protein